MKRDMDLIRQLVFKIEEHEYGLAPRDLAVDGYTEEQVGYHLHLMLDAGLIKGKSVTTFQHQSPQAMATSLTWAGHEFADAARSDTLWGKAKKHVQEKLGTAAFGLLVEYLKKLAQGELGF